jgi:LmbE family N-acetylglucosaminyl deacetylase
LKSASSTARGRPCGRSSDALDATVDRVRPGSPVFSPWGLFHTDHLLAHGPRSRCSRRGVAEWLVYEEAPSRRQPALVAERVATLRAAGLTVTECVANDRPASDVKRRALACYASQMRALSTLGNAAAAEAHRPERYWRVVVAPPA